MSLANKSHQSLGALRALAAVILLWFGGFAVSVAASQDSPGQGKGLLWRVEKEDGASSYLYGTMHVSDPRVTVLSPPVRQAFDSARSFHLEVQMDYEAYAKAMRGMFFSDGTTLRSVIGDELFAGVVRMLAPQGVSEQTVLNMKPWAVMSSVGMPGFGQGVALDLQLYTSAMKQGKPVYGLESIEEQLGIFDAMPRQAQIEMVKSVLEKSEEDEQLFASFVERYLERDLDALMSFGQEYLSADYPAFAAAFQRIAIDDRNLRMVERMQTALKEGEAFIAVGALHLPGRHGILRLLEQRGFSVTPVY